MKIRKVVTVIQTGEANRRRSTVEEDEVVSFVNDAKTVIEQLSKGRRKQNVLSIVGMGGLLL